MISENNRFGVLGVGGRWSLVHLHVSGEDEVAYLARQRGGVLDGSKTGKTGAMHTLLKYGPCGRAVPQPYWQGGGGGGGGIAPRASRLSAELVTVINRPKTQGFVSELLSLVNRRTQIQVSDFANKKCAGSVLRIRPQAKPSATSPPHALLRLPWPPCAPPPA